MLAGFKIMLTEAPYPVTSMNDNLKTWENAALCYGLKGIQEIFHNSKCIVIVGLCFYKMLYNVTDIKLSSINTLFLQ